MAVVLVDFDTTPGRDFEVVRPIGVWVAQADGSIAVKYRPEVEDAEDPGHDNYLRTLRALEEFVDQWRAGQGQPDFPALLEYVSESSYLGWTFRTVGSVEDPLTVDEAYERFVIEEQALPVTEGLTIG